MNVLPVIERELRASSRHPFTYSVRMMAVGATLLVCLMVALDGGIGNELGGRLFAILHSVVLGTIWVLVPFLTADCISRERREATLSLLFLTPLKAPEIVIAKSVAQGLRAFTLWLAALPVLTIPFVAGGVGWLNVVLSILTTFSSICLCLGLGLVASACCRVWMRALALSAALSFGGSLLFVLGAGLAVGSTSGFTFWTNRGAFGVNDLDVFSTGWVILLGLGEAWQNFAGSSPGGGSQLLSSLALLTLLSVLFLLLLVRLAAWRVARVWQERPPSATVAWLRSTLCTPVVCRSFFRRWMNWELNRNPIGWLERRTWTGRLVTWSWFAIVISVYTSLLSNLWLYQRGFHGAQTFLAWLLVGSVASSAAGSFRRERETGVLELLLVAPLREWHIIGGRVRGLWGQFLPAVVLLLAVWLYCANFLGRVKDEVDAVFFYALTFATLPIIGLFYSLTTSTFISAFLRTLLVGVILPAAMARIEDCANFLLYFLGLPTLGLAPDSTQVFLPTLVQALLAAGCAWRLHENLKRRRFAMEGA